MGAGPDKTCINMACNNMAKSTQLTSNLEYKISGYLSKLAGLKRKQQLHCSATLSEVPPSLVFRYLHLGLSTLGLMKTLSINQ